VTDKARQKTLSKKKMRYVRFYGRGKNGKEKKRKGVKVKRWRGVSLFRLLTRRGAINMLEQSAEKPLNL